MYYVDYLGTCSQRTSESVESSFSEIKYLYVHSLYDWMAALSSHSFSSLEEFLGICF